MNTPETGRRLLELALTLLVLAGLWAGCASPPPPPPEAAPPPPPPAPAGAPPGWLPSILPSDMLVDDGYTRYEAINHPSEEGAAASWSITGRFRLYTDVPPRSLLKMRVLAKGSPIQENLCDFKPGLEDGPPFIVTEACGDPSFRMTGKQTVRVEWHFLNGATDVPTHLRTHTVTVHAVPRVGADMEPIAPEYIVDQGAESLMSVLWPRPARGLAYLPAAEPQLAPDHGIYEMVLNISPSTLAPPAASRFFCAVDGRALQLGPGSEHGPVEVAPGSLTLGTYRRAPKRKETQAYEEMFAYQQLHLQLPLGHGGGDLVQVAGHPGTWNCTWETEEGTLLRSFRWIVLEDGHITPHPEQYAGVTLAPGALLVATTIPKKGTFDARVDRAAVQKRAFYGRGFRTPEGKAQARALPRIGSPTPPRR